MASFLRGAKNRGQRAIVLSSDDRMLELSRDEISKAVPEMADALTRILGPHAVPTPAGLRPVSEALDFASAHPEGASLCGDTIPSFLNRRCLLDVLAYEDWFDGLRPFYHRGLCPYDLTNIPVDRAPEALGRLAKAHTHGVLSRDPDPAVRFLQLLILPHVENPPEEHLGWLAQAVDLGLVNQDRGEDSAELTPRGQNFARALAGLPRFLRQVNDRGTSRRRGLLNRAESTRLPRQDTTE
ncbi:MAG: hypothetical protein WA691_01995 [Thermoplasmata archaeon]